MKIFTTILLGLALWVLLKSGFYLARIASRNKKVRQYVLRFQPWLEVAGMLGFVFFAIHRHVATGQVFFALVTSLVVVVVFLLGWFVLREVIAGAVLRSDQVLESGMFVKLENLSGTIQSVGLVSLELQTPAGEKVRVPYSQAYKQNIARDTVKGQGKGLLVRVKVPQKHSPQNIQNMLRQKLLEMPWVLAGAGIKITMQLKEKYYDAEIHFQAVNEDSLSKTEELLQSYVRENFSDD